MTQLPSQQKRAQRAKAQFLEGKARVTAHPLYSNLLYHISVRDDGEHRHCPEKGKAVVRFDGIIYCNTQRLLPPGEWALVIAHALLHLAFEHFAVERRDDKLWQIACCGYINRFLWQSRFLDFEPPLLPQEFARLDERAIWQRLHDEGLPAGLPHLGISAPGEADMVWSHRRKRGASLPNWGDIFARALQEAVRDAVDHAGASRERRALTLAEEARLWFVNHYPLLGALASGFKLIHSIAVCQRLDIGIAAVDEEMREVYINPLAQLNEMECRFVMAHELLHVGLRHARRRQGRDPFLWNVACDYVINQWLIEMGIGTMPQRGLLYDPELKGLSAESIYDRLIKDLRRARKLMTFRGVGMGDIIDKHAPEWWNTTEGMTLDQFYREVLTQGMDYMSEIGRGYLPAGLLEEIRALAQRPIPWDVALGEWFDRFFLPLERHRSYARPSRRQAATPDIPRPRYVVREDPRPQRTFGVVLDTSGSMDRHLLAKALGTIASYAMARDVPAVRLVFCDAEAYDEGYVAPELIGDRVRVKGRGGTILQPGIDLLERADDFPATAPILVITDGACDDFRLRREHAILLPQGRMLPFAPRGPVFHIPMG